jgi:anti-sigma regulatory factor (Ser/Thr protein kinase)
MVTTEAPGVSMRMEADDLAVKVAAKVAAGVADALDLAFGPGRRLTAITLEATRNVVEHADAKGTTGVIELRIALEPPRPHNGNGPQAPEIHVSVRDFGNGCPLEPTSNDPPGLGLSIMSELSEELTITSRRDGGTEIDALIRSGGEASEVLPRAQLDPPQAVSELTFEGPELLRAVLPRAMAAHAAEMDASMDAVEDAMQAGRAIADSLADEKSRPAVRISRSEDGLAVRIGTLGAAADRELLGSLRSAGGPGTSTSAGTDRAGDPFVLIDVPLH